MEISLPSNQLLIKTNIYSSLLLHPMHLVKTLLQHNFIVCLFVWEDCFALIHFVSILGARGKEEEMRLSSDIFFSWVQSA